MENSRTFSSPRNVLVILRDSYYSFAQATSFDISASNNPQLSCQMWRFLHVKTKLLFVMRFYYMLLKIEQTVGFI